ncbi:hypothetical protein JCM24511_05563 [Saitozyma sp. JCM 24511]|nr:hypothetical protein JCM24511_05563 [Saitozyma sp. JCM 24511]
MPTTLSPHSVTLNSPDQSSPPTSGPAARLPSPIITSSPDVASAPGDHSSSPIDRPAVALLIQTDRSQDELESKWLPKLGRLRVDREVVLSGYALYSLRTWFLSRTHWSQTIVTQTGKPTEHISAYLIVPDPELAPKVGELEVHTATKLLMSETHAQARKTEWGTLLVNTPSSFRQDIFPVPGGDLRQARPYLLVNTGLRRLGCGGRAAMALEPPIPALRRKFHELYRLPTPPGQGAPIGRTVSPTTSPSKPEGSPGSPSSSNHPVLSDPFTLMLKELVKLIQAALALWGMFGTDREDLEIDGLFCDETKAGIFQWRREMGMEHEESLKLEKETSGGCIDPKTLAALLSSVTSTRYHLAQLGVEKLPKDPFGNPRRFLSAWHSYQISIGRANSKAQYLTVSSVRALNAHFMSERIRSPGDALKVPRFLLSGVASAASSVHANLKGGGAEDTPLRKREHHAHFLDHASDDESGVGLIIPDEEVGSFASPNAITTNLEAYISGVLKSREKDWDTVGARRVAQLWNGHVVSDALKKQRSGKLRHDVRPLRKRTTSRDVGVETADGSDTGGGGARGALKEMTVRTGQVLKGGLNFARRGTVYETSDSDPGGGQSSIRNVLARKRQSMVPTVIEPDVEEVEEQLVDRASLSPSPSFSNHNNRNGTGTGTGSIRAPFLGAASRASTKRPSIITSLSNEGSDAASRSLRGSSVDLMRRSPLEERWEAARPSDGRQRPVRTVSERAAVWHDRGRATTMLRTASDGADVVIEEGGNEWEVLNPHGTAKGQHDDWAPLRMAELRRRWGVACDGTDVRHSLQDRMAYSDVRVSPSEHLAIDVEMCAVVLELREKERELARKEDELKTLEDAVFKASQDVIDAVRARRTHLARLNEQADAVKRQLGRSLEEVEEDESLNWTSKKIQFYLSEDTNTNEVTWNLRQLHREWEAVRKENERRRKEAEEVEEKRGWWRFGM